MLYLPFIISNILSAAVSAAVTVYLIRYFILKHKNDFFIGLQDRTQTKEVVKSNEVYTKEPEIEHKVTADYKNTEETILRPFLSTKQKSKFRIYNPFTKVFRAVLNFSAATSKKLFYFLHAAVHFLSISIDILFTHIFGLISAVLGSVLVPAYKLFYRVRKFSIGSSFGTLYERLTGVLSVGRRQSQKDVQEAIKILEKPLPPAFALSEGKDDAPDVKPKEEDAPKKLLEKNHLSFSVEVYLSALFIVATFFPFVFKLHQSNPHIVLLYCLGLLSLGAYTLLYKKSTRVFWAIGVSMWVMLSFWYFEGAGDSLLGSVIIFLCAFLCVYALSSFIWYGLRSNQATFIEYGLFVLHPFLYLAGVYLLLINGSKSFVVILCAAVAALYIYFAQEVKNKKAKSKIHTDFIYTSQLVAIVSLLALVCVATNGFLTIGVLCTATLVYLNLTKEIEVTFLILLLLTVFGQTLGVTNTSPVYAFVANERCISYIAAASLFVYVINFTKHRKGLFLKGVKTFAIVATAFIVFFGATVEILDAKVNSTIFTKGVPEIVLGAIYLLIGGYLFYAGEKDRNMVIKVVAVLFSIYSLYFITTKLLG